MAAGATTRQAVSFYHRYAIDWVKPWTNLAQLANNHVKITGPVKVLSARPIKIRLGGHTQASVTLRRCLDERRLVVTQQGKRLAQPQLKTPHLYRVTVDKKTTEKWWRSGVVSRGASC